MDKTCSEGWACGGGNLCCPAIPCSQRPPSATPQMKQTNNCTFPECVLCGRPVLALEVQRLPSRNVGPSAGSRPKLRKEARWA